MPSSPQEASAGARAIPLSLSVVDPALPGLVIQNDTDVTADGLIWQLVTYRESDLAAFSFAVQAIGYVKPHSRTAVYSMSLANMVKASNGGRELNPGDVLDGSLTLDCPTCTGETYVIHLEWGVGDGISKLRIRPYCYCPRSRSMMTVFSSA